MLTVYIYKRGASSRSSKSRIDSAKLFLCGVFVIACFLTFFWQSTIIEYNQQFLLFLQASSILRASLVNDGLPGYVSQNSFIVALFYLFSSDSCTVCTLRIVLTKRMYVYFEMVPKTSNYNKFQQCSHKLHTDKFIGHPTPSMQLLNLFNNSSLVFFISQALRKHRCSIQTIS